MMGSEIAHTPGYNNVLIYKPLRVIVHCWSQRMWAPLLQ